MPKNFSIASNGETEILGRSVRLPCSGRQTLNRLVKVAMYESLSDFGGGLPNQNHFTLYERWSQGDWGMVITGNVQVDRHHLTLGRDMFVPAEITPETEASFRRLASAMRHGSSSSNIPTSPSSLAILQLSHAGRQSPQILGGRVLTPASAPSCVPMRPKEGMMSSLFHGLLFPPPRAMSDEQVKDVVKSFVQGARLAGETGFDGVQLHCSHGYLLAQFLSPKTNRRPPPYGPPGQLSVIQEIVTQIRQVVPPTFVLGVKVNAADYVDGGVSEEQALSQVTAMASWNAIDFIEISGGDYERPDFMMKASPRQAFFSHFSRLAMDALPQSPTSPVIMLTGSLRTPSVMAETIRARHAHLIGLGRPSIIYPSLPRILLSSQRDEANRPVPTPDSALYYPEPPAPPPYLDLPIKILGAGFNTAWYCSLMLRIAKAEWQGLETPCYTRTGEGVGDSDAVRALDMPRVGTIQSLWDLWVRN